MQLTPEQQEFRARNVTASQFATILGVSPWSSPHAISKWKVTGEQGFRTQELEDAAQRGHYLEKVVAESVCDILGIEARRMKRPKDVFDYESDIKSVDDTIVHPHYPLAATPDYLISIDNSDEWINYEIKTAGSSSGWFANSVPEVYFLQIQFQMFVLNACGLRVNKTLLGGLVKMNFEHRWVDYDPNVVLRNLDRCIEFQTNCDNGIIEEKPETKKGRTKEEDLDELQTIQAQLFAKHARHKKEAEANYRETGDGLRTLLGSGMGVSMEDGGSIIYICEKEVSKLNLGRYIKALENFITLKGGKGLVKSFRDDCTENSIRKPFLQYRSPRKPKS